MIPPPSAAPARSARRMLWAALVAGIWVAAVLIHVVRPSDLWVAVAFIGVLAGAAVLAWVGSRTAAPERAAAGAARRPGSGEQRLRRADLVHGRHRQREHRRLVRRRRLAGRLRLPDRGPRHLAGSRRGPACERDVDSLIDAATIVTVSVMVLWNISVASIAGDPSLTPFIKLVWSTYPIADAILLALVLRIATDRRRAPVDGPVVRRRRRRRGWSPTSASSRCR